MPVSRTISFTQLKVAIMRGSFDWGTYFLSFIDSHFNSYPFVAVICVYACVCASINYSFTLCSLSIECVVHFGFYLSITISYVDMYNVRLPSIATSRLLHSLSCTSHAHIRTHARSHITYLCMCLCLCALHMSMRFKRYYSFVTEKYQRMKSQSRYYFCLMKVYIGLGIFLDFWKMELNTDYFDSHPWMVCMWTLCVASLLDYTTRIVVNSKCQEEEEEESLEQGLHHVDESVKQTQNTKRICSFLILQTVMRFHVGVASSFHILFLVSYSFPRCSIRTHT